MGDTTFEEAKRCPRCLEPGAQTQTKPEGRGKLHFFECKNSRCTWYEKPGWIVQVSADGSIPTTKVRHKKYPTLPDHTDRVRSAVDREYAASLKPGGEIKGR